MPQIAIDTKRAHAIARIPREASEELVVDGAAADTNLAALVDQCDSEAIALDDMATKAEEAAVDTARGSDDG